MVKIDFAKGDGLVPCIVQDVDNGDVLMLGYMNEKSLSMTIETGLATYWSRSRQELWVKGETSGHYQHVDKITGLSLIVFCEEMMTEARSKTTLCRGGSARTAASIRR